MLNPLFVLPETSQNSLFLSGLQRILCKELAQDPYAVTVLEEAQTHPLRVIGQVL